MLDASGRHDTKEALQSLVVAPDVAGGAIVDGRRPTVGKMAIKQRVRLVEASSMSSSSTYQQIHDTRLPGGSTTSAPSSPAQSGLLDVSKLWRQPFSDWKMPVVNRIQRSPSGAVGVNDEITGVWLLARWF